MEDKIFNDNAKQMVDIMFNTKLFKEDITRDDMAGFEDLIQYLLKYKFESYVKVEKFNQSVKKQTT